MTSRAIIKSDLSDQAKAEKHFREVLKHGANRPDILAVFAEQPSAALARLNDTKALTDRGAADILDEVVGQVPNNARARELLEQELPPERLRQLLLARGDLYSSAAYVVSLTDIVQVVLADMGEQMAGDENEEQPAQVIEREISETDLSIEDRAFARERQADMDEHLIPPSAPQKIQLDIDSPAPLYILLDWAHKLKDRDDYEEFLATNLGRYSILQCILLALWHEARCPDISENEILESGVLDNAGLDTEEANDALRDLFASGAPIFSRAEIEDARFNLSKRRKEQKQAPTMVDEARDVAAQVKDELDF